MERQAVAKAQKPAARTNQPQRPHAAASPSAHSLLVLQQSVGNQAVQRLIGSDYFQAKLTVSTPGDPYEREADRVAETVMRMPDPVVNRVPLAVREDDDEETIATKLESTQPDDKDEIAQPKPISD